jgi:hypothetical protein
MSNKVYDRPRATVIADSITPWGHRLTSVEVEHHRPLLAETNTPRVFTRSSASSRAIPVTKQLSKFEDDPAFPIVWGSEQKGMQAGPPLEGADLDDADVLFRNIRNDIAGRIRQYVETHPIGDDAPEGSVRLHKQWLNRPLEVFQWHTALWTATSWENFWHQRIHPAAMPEFRLLAEAHKAAIDASTPRLLQPGEYHLPYVWDDQDVIEWAREKARYAMDAPTLEEAMTSRLVKVSCARSARNSYNTQHGTRDPEEDLNLYVRLSTDDPMHAAPLEHVATPASWNEHTIRLLKVNGRLEVSHGPTFPPADYPHLDLTLPVVGNFVGFQQHRLEVEFDRQIRSFT